MLTARFRPLLFVIACMALTGALWGQGITTGAVTGVVVDSQGAVVTNAHATAVQNGTNVTQTAMTNASGEFQIRLLPVGTYQVTIEGPGFEKMVINDVVVNAGQPTTVGRRALGVAGAVQSLKVESVSPLLQTDPVQISTTFETKKLEDLPIGNGLDAVALLTPGVVTAGDLGSITGGNGASFSANGQRIRDNNYEIDGQSNNDTDVASPIVFFNNQDAIEEIQVFTNYSAEYGRTSGSVVNYITKQGTNQFHGTGYEIYNGTWGDALTNQSKSPLLGNCPSGVAAGSPIPGYPSCTAPNIPRVVDNRFGGTVGGPIVPDKLWFFGSTNFDLTHTGVAPATTGTNLFPDPTGIAQLDAAFPGNTAVAVIKAFGPSTVPGTVSYGSPVMTSVGGTMIEEASVTRLLATPSHDYEATGRVDWQISNKDRIFARYIFEQTLAVGVSGGNGIAIGDFVNEPAREQQLGIDYSRTFTSNLLNQVRYSYGRENVAFEGGGYPTCTRANYAACPTAIGFQDNTQNFGGDIVFPQGRFVIDHQFQDNASLMHGKHFLKWGGEFHRQSQPDFFAPNFNGSYTYPDLSAFILDNQPGKLSAGAASATLALTIGPPNIDFSENQFALYFQDDWKPLDNLTVSLGLRYELFGQANNVLHDQTVARESNPSTAFWDPTLPLSVRTVPSLPLNTKNFGPVIGFAYNPRFPWLGHDTTVIRGGFRIAYNPAFYNLFTNVSAEAPVVNATQFHCNQCLPAAGTGSAVVAENISQVPIGGNPGTGFEDFLPSKFLNPYTEAWQFGIQHEFGSKIVSELRYVGNHGVHLYQTVDGNPFVLPLYVNGFANAVPSSVTPCTDPTQVGFGYVNCNRSFAYENTNTGYSFYNGLQMRLDVRDWHGLTAGASYTFSRAIDNTTEVFATGNGGNTIEFTQNPLDQNERGLSGVDFPNDFTLYMIYQLPFLKSQKGFVGKALGGWEVSPIYRYNSGQLYTVLQNHPSWEAYGAVISPGFAGPTDPGNYTVPGSFTGSLCDPNGLFQTDICRPILSNRNAPIGTVGVYCNPGYVTDTLPPYTSLPVDPTCPGAGTLYAYSPSAKYGHTGAPILPSDVHWIYNDVNAANVSGTPYGGAGRNLYRGDPVNTVNMSLQKEFRFRERYGLQVRITAYNLLNHMFLGTPGVNISSGASFGTNVYNGSGGGSTNTTFQGLAQRHFELQARILF